MAPEIIHMVALSGYLSAHEVAMLAGTCKQMAEVLTHDPYGRNIHKALLGVVANVEKKEWVAASYAMARHWVDGEERTLWREVANLRTGQQTRSVSLASPEEKKEWGNILLQALQLPAARGGLEFWAPSVREGWRNTSVLLLTSAEGCANVVEWVLEKTDAVDLEDVANKSRDTPLHAACREGHLEVVKMLVEAGLDVTARDLNRSTPLFDAARYGHADVVEYLLGVEGVDVNAEDGMGGSPLRSACMRGQLPIIRMLLAAGAEVAKPNPFGPLYSACGTGNTEVAALLLEAGAGEAVVADPEIGAYLLRAASGEGHAEIIRMLAELPGIDVDGVTGKGETPLHVACKAGFVDVVRVLIDAGADVGLRVVGGGETALELAERMGHDDVVAVLTGENVGENAGGSAEE